MPLHFEKLENARDCFPPGIREIIDEALQTNDEVHQFIRVTSAFEYLIKLLSATIHGAVRDTLPGPWYGEMVRSHFIEKAPSLGDWTSSAEAIRKRVSRHPSLSPLIDAIWENRRKKDSNGNLSAAWNMCRVVRASRAFITEVPPSTNFNYAEVFGLVVNLRNSYSHGALTVRFARRFGQPVTDALAEVGSVLELAKQWQFIVPLRFDPGDRNNAVVMDSEALGTIDGGHVRSLEHGDRVLKWGRLYLNPIGSQTLETAILLEPLVRYEQSHRDIQFFNRYDAKELTAEYLSYRSGDFDFDPAFDVQVDSLGAVSSEDNAEDPEEVEIAATHESQDEGASADALPQEDNRLLDRVSAIIQDGVHEKTLRRCRERVHRELDSLETTQQQAVLAAVADRLRELDEPHIHRVLGNVLRDFSFFEAASKELKAAVNASPEDKYLHQHLGHALLQYGTEQKQSGRTAADDEQFQKGKSLIEEAKRELAASLFTDPDDPVHRRFNVRSLSMLVDANCRLGEFDEALQRCTQGLQLEPDNQRLLDQKDFLQGQGAN
ncbi:hypothetical protein [Maioricimonas sp. JC845]|uniref:hypothetical protein n=1 Tax=Maioricimonas sp. JC845 TaxID=3232138 RepID=UPI003457E78D